MNTNELKCTDLRIGNFLKRNNKIVKVNGLSRNEVKYTDNDKGETVYDIMFFHPIELTEEVLLKIGFEKERQLISNLFYLDYETDVDTIIRVKYVIYPNRNSLPLLIITTSRYENYECCEFMNQGVKYLHELQNAYFLLTGRELEVEL